jgi:hypothetical protein
MKRSCLSDWVGPVLFATIHFKLSVRLFAESKNKLDQVYSITIRPCPSSPSGVSHCIAFLTTIRIKWLYWLITLLLIHIPLLSSSSSFRMSGISVATSCRPSRSSKGHRFSMIIRLQPPPAPITTSPDPTQETCQPSTGRI